MAINPLRKLFHFVGLDIHRFQASAEPMEFLRTLDIKTVIDVGANTGQFSQEIRDILPDAHIIAFEPLKDCYEALLYNRVSDAHFEAYNVALGAEEEETVIHRSSYSQSSSLRPMAKLHKELFPHTAGETREQIRVKRLDDVLADKELARNILLKIDVQGYEDKVLAGGPKTLAGTKAVVLETSFIRLYEGQPLFADIYQRLYAEGFSYHGALHQKYDKKTGEVLFEDALFIR